MEPIELPILSPRADLSGIDKTIAELERLDTLLKALQGNSRLNFKVDVTGAEGIRSIAGVFDDLLGTLSALGENGWAQKLRQGLVTPKEAMSALRREMADLAAASNELNERMVKNYGTLKTRQEKGSNRLGEGDKEFHGTNDAILKRNSEMRAQLQSKQERMNALSRADALAGALPMTYAQSRNAAAASTAKLADETAKAAVVEKKLEDGSHSTTEALAAQSAVVAQKTKLMQSLAGSVEKVTQAEKSLATQSGTTADKQASAAPVMRTTDGALLSTRTVTDAEGLQTQTVKRRNEVRDADGKLIGVGADTARPDGSLVEDRSAMQVFKERQREIDAAYKRRAAELAGNNFGKGSAQRNAALEVKAGDLDKLAADMSAAGLPNVGPAGAAAGIRTQLGDAGILENRRLASKQNLDTGSDAQRMVALNQKARQEREKKANADWKAATAERRDTQRTEAQFDAENQRRAQEAGSDPQRMVALNEKARQEREKKANADWKAATAERRDTQRTEAQFDAENQRRARETGSDPQRMVALNQKARQEREKKANADWKAAYAERDGASRDSSKYQSSEFDRRQKEIDNEYKQRTAKLVGQGIGKESAPRRAALEDKAKALDQLADEMKQVGLTNFKPAGAAAGIRTQLGDAGMSAQQKAEAKSQRDGEFLRKQAAAEQAKAQREAKAAAVAQAKVDAAAAKVQAKAAEDAAKAQREADEAAAAAQRTAENRNRFSGAGKPGSTRTTNSSDGSTSTTSQAGNMRYTEKTDAAGNVTASKISETDKAHKSMGATFVGNTLKVAAWTASVGVLYGALNLVKTGFSAAFSLDRQYATLQSVFKGTEQEARGLMQTTLALGAAHGRAAGEAVEAVTEWSRAQLTAAQAGEALRVSLMAANVAEISSAEAGKNLAAIYTTNSLRITDLTSVLGMMNTVSNTTKVRTSDLLDGFAQVGPLAAEAGMSIATTNALIGTTVAATARSGAQIGTSLKAVLVSMSDPRIQDYLRGRFGIESRTQDGDVKGGGEILDEVFVKSRGMNRAERGEMLVNVAGKHQASKVEAMLENYPEAARKAIESQLDLNSAQREEHKILDTTIAKWETLKTQWATAFDAFHQAGGKTVINGTMEGLGKIGESIGGIVETWSFWKSDKDTKYNKLRKSNDLTFDQQFAQNDIDSANQSGARADANKGIQKSIDRILSTGENSRPEVFAKDAKQIAMTLERTNSAKQKALLDSLIKFQGKGDLVGMAGVLAPYNKQAMKMESNSIVGEQSQRAGLLEKADFMESQLSGADFQGEDARAISNREKQKNIIAQLREAGKPVDKSTFSDDEAGRMAAQLMTPVQESMAALGATTPQRGLFGEGFSYRLSAMSGVERANARYGAVRGQVGIGADEIAKAKQDLLAARAQLNVSDSRDVDFQSERGFSLDLARNSGGGTEGQAALRRANFFGTELKDTRAEGPFLDRGREAEVVAATTAALREQQELSTNIARTEADIVSQRERQNVEASKALQLASREDQARSALLAGFTQRNGRLSPEQFQFFSSGFRQSSVRLNPDGVPQQLTGVGDMEQNLAMMREASAKMAEIVAGLVPLAQAAFQGQEQRDAQLRFDIEVNITDSIGEAARAFADLATARLNEVVSGITAKAEAAIQVLRGGQAGDGAAAVLGGD